MTGNWSWVATFAPVTPDNHPPTLSAAQPIGNGASVVPGCAHRFGLFLAAGFAAPV